MVTYFIYARVVRNMPIIGSSDSCTVFLLGPQRSGKTNVLLGLYLAARERGNGVRSSSNLQKLLDDSFQDRTFPEATADTVHEISFEINHEGLLSNDMKIETVDYAGEWFQTIVEELENIDQPYRQKVEEYDNGVANINIILEYLLKSNIIILLFDGSALYEGELPSRKEYLSLVTELINSSTTNQTIVPVVTKVDELYDKMSKDGVFQNISDSIKKFQEMSTSDLKNAEMKIGEAGISSFEGSYSSHKNIVNSFIQHRESTVLADLEFYPVSINPERKEHAGFSEILDAIYDNC